MFRLCSQRGECYGTAEANAAGLDLADIFISYKREDRARIEPLARMLEKHGYTVWWDLELVPSQKFERQIKAELDAAKCIVVVWTAASVDEGGAYRSEWIHHEAEFGDQHEILVPVQLDAGCTHWRHRQRHFAELHNWSGQETANGFQSLLRGIALYAGSRTPPFDQELASWLAAEKAETAAAFRDFLRLFPESRFATLAIGRALDLEETEAWTAMGESPSARDLIHFLRKFPSGRFGDEAATRVVQLANPEEPPSWDGSASPSGIGYGPTWRVQAESMVSTQLGRRFPTSEDWRFMSPEERRAIGQLIAEPARFDFERVKRHAQAVLRSSLQLKAPKNLQSVAIEIDRFLNDWSGFLIWRERESSYRDNWRAELVHLRKRVAEHMT